MSYIYTTFTTESGYAWQSGTPDNIRKLTDYLNYCGSGTTVLIALNSDLFRIACTYNEAITVRQAYQYTVDCITAESFTTAESNLGNRMIQNYLRGHEYALDGYENTSENVNLLNAACYFVAHLPSRLTDCIVINKRWHFVNGLYRIADADEETELPIFPAFDDTWNMMYRYLYECENKHSVHMLTFIAMLFTDVVFSPISNQHLVDYLNYLKLLANPSVYHKIGYGAELHKVVSKSVAKAIFDRAFNTPQTIMNHFPLLNSYGLNTDYITSRLQEYGAISEQDSYALLGRSAQCISVHEMFIRAVEGQCQNQTELSFASDRQIVYLFDYCINHQIEPVRVRNALNPDDVFSSGFLAFYSWYWNRITKEHQKNKQNDTSKTPISNKIPLILLYHNYTGISHALCQEFYGRNYQKAVNDFDKKYPPVMYRKANKYRLSLLTKLRLTHHMYLMKDKERFRYFDTFSD